MSKHALHLANAEIGESRAFQLHDRLARHAASGGERLLCKPVPAARLAHAPANVIYTRHTLYSIAAMRIPQAVVKEIVFTRRFERDFRRPSEPVDQPEALASLEAKAGEIALVDRQNRAHAGPGGSPPGT